MQINNYICIKIVTHGESMDSLACESRAIFLSLHKSIASSKYILISQDVSLCESSSNNFTNLVNSETLASFAASKSLIETLFLILFIAFPFSTTFTQ